MLNTLEPISLVQGEKVLEIKRVLRGTNRTREEDPPPHSVSNFPDGCKNLNDYKYQKVSKYNVLVYVIE